MLNRNRMLANFRDHLLDGSFLMLAATVAVILAAV